MAPSILEIAGVAIPDDVPGTSMLRMFLDRRIEETHDVSPTKRMVDMYDWETGKRIDPGPRRLRGTKEM